MTTESVRDKARRLLAGITGGGEGWEAWEVAMAPGMGPAKVKGLPLVIRKDTKQPCFKNVADAEFIAASPGLVAALLDELDAKDQALESAPWKASFFWEKDKRVAAEARVVELEAKYDQVVGHYANGRCHVEAERADRAEARVAQLTEALEMLAVYGPKSLSWPANSVAREVREFAARALLSQGPAQKEGETECLTCGGTRWVGVTQTAPCPECNARESTSP